MGEYKVFDVNCRGSSHIQNHLPKQDYSLSYSGKTDNDSPYSIAIVADGHGSPQHFRSADGSRIACEVCRDLIVNLITNKKDIHKNEENLKRFLKTKWDQDVKEHYNTHSEMTHEEIERVKEAISKIDTSQKKDKLRAYCEKFNKGELGGFINKAYGSTLICVAAWKDIVMALQIGDGTCVAFYEDGTCDQPIPADVNNVANITGSLCNDDPVCRIHIFNSDKKPVALFVASDGLDDSYGQGDVLYNYYRRLCLKLIDRGKDFESELENELSIISEKGSKDDMSIAALYDEDYISKYREFIESEIKVSEFQHKLDSIKDNEYGYNEYAFNARKSKLERLQARYNDSNNNIINITENLSRLKEQKDTCERIKNKYESLNRIDPKQSNNNKISEILRGKLNALHNHIEEAKKKIKNYTKKINEFEKEIKNYEEEQAKLEKEYYDYDKARKMIPDINFHISTENIKLEQLKKEAEATKVELNDCLKEYYEIIDKNKENKEKAEKLREEIEKARESSDEIYNRIKNALNVGKIISPPIGESSPKPDGAELVTKENETSPEGSGNAEGDAESNTEGTTTQSEESGNAGNDVASNTKETVTQPEGSGNAGSDAESNAEGTVTQSEGSDNAKGDAASNTEGTATQPEESGNAGSDVESNTEGTATQPEESGNAGNDAASNTEGTVTQPEESGNAGNDAASNTEGTVTQPEGSGNAGDAAALNTEGTATQSEGSDNAEGDAASNTEGTATQSEGSGNAGSDEESNAEGTVTQPEESTKVTNIVESVDKETETLENAETANDYLNSENHKSEALEDNASVQTIELEPKELSPEEERKFGELCERHKYLTPWLEDETNNGKDRRKVVLRIRAVVKYYDFGIENFEENYMPAKAIKERYSDRLENSNKNNSRSDSLEEKAKDDEVINFLKR